MLDYCPKDLYTYKYTEAKFECFHSAGLKILAHSQVMKQKCFEKSIQKVFLFIQSKWKIFIRHFFLLFACFSSSNLPSRGNQSRSHTV